MNYALYQKIYTKQADFFRKRAWTVKLIRFFNYALTGGVAAAYFAFCIYLSVQGKWYDLALCFAIPLACFLVEAVG